MKLAAIGSNCIDYYTNVDGGKACPGGGPVNMAVYTIRLGGEASYIGAVGNDEYGAFMKKEIVKKGVDLSHLHVLEGKTAVSNVELVEKERVFGEYQEGVLAQFRLGEDDMSFILQHDVVVADLWCRVEEQFQDLKKLGMTTAFDCANRPEAAAAKKAIPWIDYLFFSGNDFCQETKAQMKKLYEAGPSLVICMLGTKGSVCYDGKEYHWCDIVPCDNLVDTMGAGDSYIAGFLTGIKNGKSILEAMHLGAKTATETLKYFGAW